MKHQHLIQEIERVKVLLTRKHFIKKQRGVNKNEIDEDIIKYRQLLVVLNHRLNKQKHKPIEWNF